MDPLTAAFLWLVRSLRHNSGTLRYLGLRVNDLEGKWLWSGPNVPGGAHESDAHELGLAAEFRMSLLVTRSLSDFMHPLAGNARALMPTSAAPFSRRLAAPEQTPNSSLGGLICPELIPIWEQGFPLVPYLLGWQICG